MPTYEYACKSCGEHLEIVQSFKDDPLTVCPACEGPLRKVFGAVGIAFKGSGFYKTDSRPAPKSESSSSSSSSSKGDSSKSDSSSKGSSDSGSGSGSGAKSGSGSGSGSGSTSKPSESKSAAS